MTKANTCRDVPLENMTLMDVVQQFVSHPPLANHKVTYTVEPPIYGFRGPEKTVLNQGNA